MFNEEKTVEQMVLDTLCGSVTSNIVAKKFACYGGAYNKIQGVLFYGI
ncbi:hypothetical protein [Desulfotignum phosphitoxidans]|jgi:type I restriction enzyme R subunit|uniref:Uncharacterized protein n=1 Tax=Desulfotignum phosphitoxidans DSM 13687 TaxID=1286635 RepID=S0FR58_9BACT|nr:hypothetical protein [Desulfotignum phosphitoxidans]EMS77578.1 hypothetical protein Dpo_14c00620 [Desulfotignum phosphitoxidans DSM 13687]